MRNNIRVNIYNKGRFMGIETPVTNFPMDYGTYELLKEMGLNIEEYKPKVVDLTKEVKEEPIAITDSVSITKEEVSTDNSKPEAWVTKESYTEEELDSFTKPQLIEILNYRGHSSSKTGKRDPLAPKTLDNRANLISKILKTNKA